MLDNMYWIFRFLKDKCDFLTLTAHLLEKNKQQRPKTLKFSNQGFGFCFSCFKKKNYCRDQPANRKPLKGKSGFFGLQLEGSHVKGGYGLEAGIRGDRTPGIGPLQNSTPCWRPTQTHTCTCGEPFTLNHKRPPTQIHPQPLGCCAQQYSDTS